MRLISVHALVCSQAKKHTQATEVIRAFQQPQQTYAPHFFFHFLSRGRVHPQFRSARSFLFLATTATLVRCSLDSMWQHCVSKPASDPHNMRSAADLLKTSAGTKVWTVEVQDTERGTMVKQILFMTCMKHRNLKKLTLGFYTLTH